MSFVLTKKLPTPMEIKELYPVSEELAALKAEKDKEKYGQKRCWIFSGLLSALFVER